MLNDEFAGLLQLLFRDFDNAIARRQLAISFLESGANDGLLVGLVGIVGKCSHRVLAEVYDLCHLVHLVAHVLVFPLRARGYFLA